MSSKIEESMYSMRYGHTGTARVMVASRQARSMAQRGVARMRNATAAGHAFATLQYNTGAVRYAQRRVQYLLCGHGITVPVQYSRWVRNRASERGRRSSEQTRDSLSLHSRMHVCGQVLFQVFIFFRKKIA